MKRFIGKLAIDSALLNRIVLDRQIADLRSVRERLMMILKSVVLFVMWPIYRGHHTMVRYDFYFPSFLFSMAAVGLEVAAVYLGAQTFKYEHPLN